jgi:hypothetical protein
MSDDVDFTDDTNTVARIIERVAALEAFVAKLKTALQVEGVSIE